MSSAETKLRMLAAHERDMPKLIGLSEIDCKTIDAAADLAKAAEALIEELLGDGIEAPNVLAVEEALLKVENA